MRKYAVSKYLGVRHCNAQIEVDGRHDSALELKISELSIGRTSGTRMCTSRIAERLAPNHRFTRDACHPFASLEATQTCAGFEEQQQKRSPRIPHTNTRRLWALSGIVIARNKRKIISKCPNRCAFAVRVPNQATTWKDESRIDL